MSSQTKSQSQSQSKPQQPTESKFKTRALHNLGCLDFRNTGYCERGRNCDYVHEDPDRFMYGFSRVIAEAEAEAKADEDVLK